MKPAFRTPSKNFLTTQFLVVFNTFANLKIAPIFGVKGMRYDFPKPKQRKSFGKAAKRNERNNYLIGEGIGISISYFGHIPNENLYG